MTIIFISLVSHWEIYIPVGVAPNVMRKLCFNLIGCYCSLSSSLFHFIWVNGNNFRLWAGSMVCITHLDPYWHLLAKATKNRAHKTKGVLHLIKYVVMLGVRWTGLAGFAVQENQKLKKWEYKERKIYGQKLDAGLAVWAVKYCLFKVGLANFFFFQLGRVRRIVKKIILSVFSLYYGYFLAGFVHMIVLMITKFPVEEVRDST